VHARRPEFQKTQEDKLNRRKQVQDYLKAHIQLKGEHFYIGKLISVCHRHLFGVGEWVIYLFSHIWALAHGGVF